MGGVAGTLEEELDPRKSVIYLDNASTTPCDPRVVSYMVSIMESVFGNASSTHAFGRRAKSVLDASRSRVRQALARDMGTVMFTSSASESNNLAALTLVTHTIANGRRRILALSTEHKSVLSPLRYWADVYSLELVLLHVDSRGVLDKDFLAAVLDDRVGAVAVQAANSETGVLQDVAHVAACAHEIGAWCMSDVTQAVGRVPLDLVHLGVDLASFSGHKVYGPKGVGGLYLATGTPVRPLILGGGQEYSARAGTENVPGIAGMALAVELAVKEQGPDAERMQGLRNLIWGRLASLDGVTWNSSQAPLLPSHLSVRIEGVEAQDLMLRVRDVAVSAGSACNALTHQPSDVLLQMGLSVKEAEQTIRVSLGRFTTQDEAIEAAKFLTKGVAKIRNTTSWRYPV